MAHGYTRKIKSFECHIQYLGLTFILGIAISFVTKTGQVVMLRVLIYAVQLKRLSVVATASYFLERFTWLDWFLLTVLKNYKKKPLLDIMKSLICSSSLQGFKSLHLIHNLCSGNFYHFYSFYFVPLCHVADKGGLWVKIL